MDGAVGLLKEYHVKAVKEGVDVISFGDATARVTEEESAEEGLGVVGEN